MIEVRDLVRSKLDKTVSRKNQKIAIVSQNNKSVIDFLMNEREEILADERMSYNTATVFINAPLALHQACQTSKLHLIEHALCLPITPIPLKR